MSNQHIFVGKSRMEVEALCQSSGIVYRITSVDGLPKIITMDYRPKRINLKIYNNLVVDVSYG